MVSRIQSRRAAITGLVLAGLLLALTACGAIPNTSPSGRMTMPDGTVMNSSQMSVIRSTPSSSGTPDAMSTGSGSGPSVTAKMVCGDEIAGAVLRNLTVSAAPPRHAAWSNQTFSCTYILPGGSLRLSVKDLNSVIAGRAWFDGLRKQLLHPESILGISNLGFPAFQTPNGDVAFLKDGKTLLVDATQVPTALVPPGSTRTGVAYGVAAAVIACWKE